jgi:tetratricopeptide (TPR) repeat protein
MWKINSFGFLSQPQRLLETYDELNPTEDQQRRLIFAIQTRTAAGAQHDLGRYEEELELRKRLIEYYPNLVLLRMDEAWAYAGTGQIDEIRRVLKECQAVPGGRGYLDWSLWTVGDMLRAHGHREAAIEIINDYIEERLERPGDEERPHLQTGNLARLLYGAERWEEAREVFEKEPDNLTHQIYIGYIAARLGDYETANRIIEEYVDTWDDPYLYGQQPLVRACFAALMGDRDRAVLLLREAGAQGGALGHGLCHDMDLEPLFGYPPFEDLIRPKG